MPRKIYNKEKQYKRAVEYQKENTKSIIMKLHLKNDADIIKKLESVPNKQGYIKSLIRDDIKKDPNK